MPGYSIAGLIIAGDWPLPELPAIDGSGGDWAVEVAPDRPGGRFDTLVHRANNPDGRSWCTIRRGDEDRYLISFPKLADFVVLLSERRIVCYPDGSTDERIARHLLLDQVIPSVLAMDGEVVLHASAVSIDERAVAFVGPTGAGKSTVAASFATNGARLLADDFVRLRDDARGFLAVPSYPGLRLWPDSARVFARREDSLMAVAPGSEKQRLVFQTPQRASQPCPLSAIVILDDGAGQGKIDVRRLPGQRGFMAVYPHAFRLERFGRDRQRAEFDRFASLARSTAILRLQYPRAYKHLPEVRRRILKAVMELQTEA
jgi:hypothetical protein